MSNGNSLSVELRARSHGGLYMLSRGLYMLSRGLCFSVAVAVSLCTTSAYPQQPPVSDQPPVPLQRATPEQASGPKQSQSVTPQTLDTRTCGGVAYPWINNSCGSQNLYVHICYGLNGEKGQRNFPIEPGGSAPNVQVDQWSTQTSICGTFPGNSCPGDYWILLERCF
jgi:hypothetical protein